ncbi:MAG: prolyl oligopeptidase family serine peptidase, partial [Pseudomonadota bacterium]
FEGLKADALKIANAKERIPYGSIRNGYVYNFWQDETNVRGLWRRTPLDAYASEAPPWEIILDFDALAEAEDQNWVFKGVNCLGPDGRLCLVSLSNGGKDAAVQREFDVEAKAFVENGFFIPEAKSGAEWVDEDTLMVATDWGESSMTESGYPYIVKVLKRGQSLDQAAEIIRGEETDVGVWPFSVDLGGGDLVMMAREADTFFTGSYFTIADDFSGEPTKLPLPARSTLNGVFEDHMLVTLEEDWSPYPGQEFKTGDLVAFSWSGWVDKQTLPDVDLIMRPTATQAIEGVSIAKGAVLISLNDNVAQKVVSLIREDGQWGFSDIALPDNGAAGVAFASINEERTFLNYEGFLTPDSLYEYSTQNMQLSEAIKSLPAKFDASPYVVEQFQAASSDGTQIPYFVVRAKETELNGDTPTLLYAYGGFQISLNPSYSANIGKLWLDKGGAYVLANIRGGGEFGPAWHQAGLKTNRQLIFDDFIAVAEDLTARNLTSPEKLGIMGGSNGGLLMGVMYTQRPDLWNAVVCQVPLLDMLRYHLLLAGASWVDEYGSPDVAEERAFLERTSPYHNIDAAADYPEIFFVTSTKDDRVHPAHARKMAKRLSELDKPFLYYENIDGGHSAAANQSEAARRRALEYTYLAQRLMD